MAGRGFVPFSSLPNGSSTVSSGKVRRAGGTDFFCDSFDSVECETDDEDDGDSQPER